jgi:hypothetical protein
MKNRLFRVWPTVVLLAVAPLASAHHSQSGYETDKTITVKATVTRFEWTNPHCQIFFDGTDDQGNAQHWVVEMPPPSVQAEKGWTRKSLNLGDLVTVIFHPGKNGMSTGLLVKVVRGDGHELMNRP